MTEKLENIQCPSVKKIKLKIVFTFLLILIGLLTIVSTAFLVHISPPKDKIDTFNYPPEFFCKTEENHIDYQTDGKCSAYASAYLLRHLGDNLNGEELAPKINRILGFVSTNEIVDVFNHRGYQAKAYHGSIETLKQRLTNGVPIIVFIKIPKDTHYYVVVGYDEQHIYLADSLLENVNTFDLRYNHILTTEEFESVWKTGTLLPNNIYINVFKKTN